MPSHPIWLDFGLQFLDVISYVQQQDLPFCLGFSPQQKSLEFIIMFQHSKCPFYLDQALHTIKLPRGLMMVLYDLCLFPTNSFDTYSLLSYRHLFVRSSFHNLLIHKRLFLIQIRFYFSAVLRIALSDVFQYAKCKSSMTAHKPCSPACWYPVWNCVFPFLVCLRFDILYIREGMIVVPSLKTAVMKIIQQLAVQKMSKQLLITLVCGLTFPSFMYERNVALSAVLLQKVQDLSQIIRPVFFCDQEWFCIFSID